MLFRSCHPSLPVKTAGDLIRFAKSKPGQLNFASAGSGSAGHLVLEMFRAAAKIDVVHVPYKGAGPAATDVMAGQVSALFGNPLGALPHVKSGRLRALAITPLKRSPLLPELPTVAETLPGYTAGPWYCLLAPAKTPAEIVAKLNATVGSILRAPEVQSNLAQSGAEPKGGTPAELVQQIRDESERWARVIREAGIKGE